MVNKLETAVYMHYVQFKSLPCDNIVDWSKFKACADNKINVTKNLDFILKMVEKVTSIFSFSPSVFNRLVFQGLFKVGTVW